MAMEGIDSFTSSQGGPNTLKEEKIRRRDEKIMNVAKDIVKRFHQRGGALPRFGKSTESASYSEERIQEAKDAQKIKNWKKSFRNMPGASILPEDVKKYLDENLTGWRDRVHAPDKGDSPLEKAKGIVDRYVALGYIFPKHAVQEFRSDDSKQEAVRQAQRDHDRLRYWRRLEQTEKDVNPEILHALAYCDESMPGWREPDELQAEGSEIFQSILKKKSSSTYANKELINERQFTTWFESFIENNKKRSSSSGRKETSRDEANNKKQKK